MYINICAHRLTKV